MDLTVHFPTSMDNEICMEFWKRVVLPSAKLEPRHMRSSSECSSSGRNHRFFRVRFLRVRFPPRLCGADSPGWVKHHLSAKHEGIFDDFFRTIFVSCKKLFLGHFANLAIFSVWKKNKWKNLIRISYWTSGNTWKHQKCIQLSRFQLRNTSIHECNDLRRCLWRHIWRPLLHQDPTSGVVVVWVGKNHGISSNQLEIPVTLSWKGVKAILISAWLSWNHTWSQQHIPHCWNNQNQNDTWFQQNQDWIGPVFNYKTIYTKKEQSTTIFFLGYYPTRSTQTQNPHDLAVSCGIVWQSAYGKMPPKSSSVGQNRRSPGPQKENLSSTIFTTSPCFWLG